MPVRQQYFIAAAIIGLIAVMAVFAMFDYFSDSSRYAEQIALQSQGAMAQAPIPYSGAPNANVFGKSWCSNCGWRGAGTGNGTCPNCRVFLSNTGVGVPPMRGQNAGFAWFRRQEVQSARPRGVLYCPVCDFAMPSRNKAVPNSIRCPRCPAYLVSSNTASNAAAGQQAGWQPNCPLP